MTPAKRTQTAFLLCTALLLLSTGRATVAATFPGAYFYPRAYLSGPAQPTASPSTQHQFYAASSPVATTGSSKGGTTYVIRSLREGLISRAQWWPRGTSSTDSVASRGSRHQKWVVSTKEENS
ncbi:hypothetical protein V5799_013481 [Amblyomma americanum]|uniref:Secreted protein n=1 Tax=Amblyomma americanum TaxID=6943 RepID=A0AAQ4E5W9_AMBAM